MNQKNIFGQAVGPIVEDWSPRQKPASVKIQGQYCDLEPLDPGHHLQGLFEAFQWNNEGETWTYLPFGPFRTLSEFEEWLNQAARNKLFLVVIDRETQMLQGLASYHDIDVEHGVIEVGSIHYSKRIQRSCIGTEAMYLMMRYVFDDLGYRRYQWRCNALNQNSRNAALRLGFQFEGIFRQSNVFKNRNRDTAWYSIIDSEWPALKERFQKWLQPENFDREGKQRIKL